MKYLNPKQSKQRIRLQLEAFRRELEVFLARHFPTLVKAAQGGRSSQKGVALLLATFALSMILYIAMEVQYETQIEYSINKNSVSKLKAYYAARSGVELSLLRIKMFQKMKSQLAGQPGVPTQMLDMIWSFPFAWPPMLPGEMNAVDKGQIDEIVKAAKLDAAYQTVISDEGSKIDINDLDSTSKTIRETTKKLILQIFENEITNNTEFTQRNRDFRAEDLVDNIIDWLDADTVTQKGGDEHAAYPDGKNEVPPNRQFRTVQEVRLVAGMTDEIFKLLEPRITVYGAKAINPNTAPAEVIQGLHSSITNEILAEVLKRRADVMNGGQFRDANDFWSFLDGKGARIPKEIQESTPISTESAMNFRIKSIGSFNNSVSEIEVITYDIPRAASAVSTAVQKEKQDAAGGTGAAGTTSGKSGSGTKPKVEVAKGPPRIVHWQER